MRTAAEIFNLTDVEEAESATRGLASASKVAPRRKRGILERFTRFLGTGARATAGAARELGLIEPGTGIGKLFPTSFLPQFIYEAARQPGKAWEGVKKGVASEMNWQDNAQILAGRSSVGVGVAGFAADVFYDPTTYIPLSWGGKLLKLVGVGKVAGRTAKATPYVREAVAFGKGVRGPVFAIEREAARLSVEGELPAIENAIAFSRHVEDATRVQREVEQSMTVVFRSARSAARENVTQLRREARIAERTVRKELHAAEELEKAARRATADVQKERLRVARGEYRAAKQALEKARGARPTPEEVTTIRPSEAARSLERLRGAEAEAAERVEKLRVTAWHGEPLAQIEPGAMARLNLASEAERAATRLTRLRELEENAVRRIESAVSAAEKRAAERALEEVQRGIRRAEKAVERTAARARAAEQAFGEALDARTRRLMQKAVQHREKATEAAARLADLTNEAQEIGISSAYMTGKALGKKLPQRAYEYAERLAERGAIAQAHAAAQAAEGAALQRIAQTAGKEVADGIANSIAALRSRAVQRAAQMVEYGVRPAESLEKWGQYHVWRGFAKYAYPQQYIEEMRAIDPLLAAELERQSAAWRTLTGPRPGIPKAARSGRELLTEEAMEALGELTLPQRIIFGERIHGRAIAEAYRMREYSARWGKTVQEYLGMSEKARRGYVVLKPADRFGALRETPAIPRWLAAHLGLPVEGSGWERRIATWQSWLLRAQPGEVAGPWATHVVGIWKAFHVPYNLPAQARNAVTNGAMTYLVGKIPSYRLLQYWVRGVLAVTRRSDAYREALRTHAGFSHTLLRSELGMLEEVLRGVGGQVSEGTVRKLSGPLRTCAHTLASVYQGSEQAAKMAVYLYWKDRGLSSAEAAKVAMQAIFDYGDVSRVTNWLRRSGVAPFITFPLKATEAAGRGMVTDTGRFATLTKAIQAPGYMADVEEKAKEEEVMPDWMRGQMMRLPIKTAEGDTRYVQIGYYLPWGPWAEGAGIDPLSMAPIFRIVDDLFRNQSSFTGRPIVPPGVSPEEKWEIIRVYLQDSIGPRWLTRGISEIAEAAKGTPRERYGGPPVKPSVLWTLAKEVGGLRTQGLSVQRERRMRRLDAKREYDDLMKMARRKRRQLRAGEITQEEWEKVRAWVERRREEIKQERPQ